MNIDTTSFSVDFDGKVILKDGVKVDMTPRDYMCMQLLQGYVMEILLVVDEFCKKHNLTYYLGEGTLLGAMRHKGFIPWDDDVDILMPREDYEKLLQLAKDGLPEGYALDSTETNPKHWTVFAQIQMTRPVPYTKKRLEGIALYNGPAVDIFPIDYVPDDRSQALAKRGALIRVLRRTLWIKSGLHKRSWYSSLKRRLKYYYPLKIYGALRSHDSLHSQVNELMTLTNDHPQSRYATVFASLYYARRETFKREYFGEPKYVEFEGHMLPVPSGADKVLQKIYGDYMLMPPLSARKSKHFFNYNDTDEITDPEILEFLKILKEYEEAHPEYQEICLEYIKNCQSQGLPIPAHLVQNRQVEEGESPSLRAKLLNICESFKNVLRYYGRKVIRLAKRIKLNRSLKLLYKFGKKPIREKTILFDAFSGLGVLDSPRALFLRMLEREDFKDYTFVWAVNNKKLSKANLEEFKSLPNVKYIKRFSKEYMKYLSISKCIVSNSSVPKYFSRREGQLYLNTWHGVPLKVMGYERPGQRVAATLNIMQNFMNSTHILSANTFTAERMFKQAYMLDGIYKGKLIHEALPRTDAIYKISREEAREKLAKHGFKTDKKIIIYAPTWKGQLYNSLDYDLTELKDAVKTLRNNIDTNEYEVYLRVHYFIYRAILMDEEMKKICIPFTVDTDELLPAVDILISDYSSIFFDFLGTDKPILFYVPDLEDYSENRGLYIPMEDMPGPVSEKLEDIAEYIRDIDKIKLEYKEKYDAMKAWCCEREDGKNADRIIDSLFYGKDGTVINCKNDKKKILIMADFARAFIHQSQLTAMLDKIDYDKCDVTLLTGNPKKEGQKYYLENINPNVRILVNDKNPNVPFKLKHKVYEKLRNNEISLLDASELLSWDREWQRLLACSDFDELLFVHPSSAYVNWMLLGYYAPIPRKTFIRTTTMNDSVYHTIEHLKHYGRVFNTIAEFENHPDTDILK